MPVFTFTSPEGKEYEVEGPEGATESQAFEILQTQLGQQAEPLAQNNEGVARGMLGGVGNFGLGVAKGLHDVKGTLDEVASNIWSPVFKDSPERVRAENSALNLMYQDYLGDSVPAQVGRIGGQMVGTAPTMAISPLRGANIAAAVGNAALQGAASEALTASQSESPLTERMAGGAGLGAIAGGVLHGAGKFISPFMKLGQDKIVGELLTGKPEATSPLQQVKDYFKEAFVGAKANKDAAMLAKQLRSGSEIVPGSTPTVGQISPNQRLSALEKRLSGMFPEEFGESGAKQIVARNALFDEMAKSPSDIASSKKAREIVTSPMRDAAFKSGQAKASFSAENAFPNYIRSQDAVNLNVPPMAPLGANDNILFRLNELKSGRAKIFSLPENGFMDFLSSNIQSGATPKPIPVDNLVRPISDLLDEPGSKMKVVGDALNWLKDRVSTIQKTVKDETYLTGTGLKAVLPEELYSVRKDINFLLEGKYGGEASDYRYASSQLMKIRDIIDSEIEKSSPGFKEYLKTYSEMSKPIAQMDLLQNIREKIGTGVPDKISGEEPISLSKMKTQMRANDDEIARILTKEQRKKLDLIISDMERQASTQRVPPVSSQEVNDLGAKSLYGIVGREGSLRETIMGMPVVKKIPSLAYGHLDYPIQKRAAEALIDPRLSAEILDKLTANNVALSNKQRIALNAILSGDAGENRNANK